VLDSGLGFDMEDKRSGLWLISMEERVSDRRNSENRVGVRRGYENDCAYAAFAHCLESEDHARIRHYCHRSISWGVEALQQLASQFPPDLPAAVLIVLHMPPPSRSLLPEILSRSGPLPAVHPENAAAIEPGCVYIASSRTHAGAVHYSCKPAP
jgi:CheB methylesterase